MSKILALADAYADAYCDYIVAAGQLTHPIFAPVKQAKEALQAEVERTERRVFDMRVIFDAACTERDALRAELEAARKDAARLRDAMQDVYVAIGQGGAAYDIGQRTTPIIRAAMEATK